ncbi:hypothetical protein N8J89_39110 [Crossiella sp. CA-258035]|uniref:hypothetical protein n=1 Tax=Crossiella sp. CA-258035 TaxID=2981138 RepID=UPI0024BC2C12|nr:hypothetical protein [Crossiella sp. CA-258035]WHT19038.1 hypothetical protein N8J89_39110 [Crossiella sp. CA-258035]
MIKQTVALLAAAGAMLGGTATAMADEDTKSDRHPASQFFKNDDAVIEVLNNTNIQLPVCLDDPEVGLVPVDALNKKYDGACIEAEMESASEN